MTRLLTFLLVALPTLAVTRSAVIPTTSATGSIASSGYGSTSMRLELRLHGQNWSSASTVNSIVKVGGFKVQYLGGSSLPNRLFFEAPDPSSSGYGNCNVVIGSPADITIRIQRDVPNLLAYAAVFDTQTGVQLGSTCTYTLSGLSSGATIQAAGIGVGATNADGDIAFLRWYSGIVSNTALIPVAVSTPADLGDWEFEDVATDSSGNGQTIATISTYANTPSYSPACNAGSQQTARLGTTLQLDGSGSYPLDGGTTLTYSWAYATGSDSINQAATLSNSAIVNPVASHLLTFGSANFTLTVTDGSAQSSVCTVHDGVVPFDATTFVVDMAAEGRTAAQITIAGPLIAYGHNTWPFADNRDLAELALQSCNLGLAAFTACTSPGAYSQYWKVFATGTIAFGSGSTTVTGTGTSFKALFCGGGTTPVNTPYLMWRYTGTDSITHYTQMPVTACADDTHITISAAYPSSPAAPWPAAAGGLSFRAVDNNTAAAGTWLFNSAPGNYYDNLMAAMVLYWRSGFDTAYDFKEAMALRWLELPITDYFFNCAALTPPPTGYSCLASRSLAVTGIVLYEQDGHPELLPGLRKIWETADFQLNAYVAGGLLRYDQRDHAYWLANLGLCGLIESGANLTFCQTALTNALSVFTSLQDSFSGAFPQFYASRTSITADPFNGGGSVAVTNGSTTVTGTGTSFSSADVNRMFVTWTGTAANAPPRDNSTVDSVQYYFTAVNAGAQTATLNTPYAGSTASGKGYATSDSLLAWGIQPVFQGLLGTAFYLAGEATTGSTQTTYRSYMNSTVQAIINSMIATQGGIYYSAYNPGCVPPFTYSLLRQWCYGTDAFNAGASTPSQSRTLSLETMRAISQTYLRFAIASVKTAGDLLMSQMFSTPTSGPNYDGFYVSDYNDGATFMIGTPPIGQAPKWWGELSGFGSGIGVWDVARIAVPQPGSSMKGTLTLKGKVGVK